MNSILEMFEGSVVNMDLEQKQEPSVDKNEIEIDIDDDFKLSLDIRAKMELLERPGRRFCKKCMSMKVMNIIN